MKPPVIGAWVALLSCTSLAAQEPLDFASGSWFDPARNAFVAGPSTGNM